MTVVDVTQWYSPVSGGIRTYLREKAAWAARAGRPHAAVATGARDGEEAVASSRFVLVRGVTPARRWGYRPTHRRAAVLRALDELRPSIVVLHDPFAFPNAIARWAAARGIAVAMICHSDARLAAAGWPRPLRAPAVAVLRRAQRGALRAPQAVVVASETSRAAIARDARGPVTVSPLGVDAAAFAAASPDPRLRAQLAPRGGRLLLYAGRLSSEKRVDLLPPMLAALGPGYVLALAGGGAAAGPLMRSARRLGVAERLRLLGHLGDRSALATLMATADAFVHPNPAEPFGLCPLEALAAGSRVVAPASGGTGELLRGRGATLVAPDDPVALAEGVRAALRGPRPSADLADLSWERTFAREWALYAELAVGA